MTLTVNNVAHRPVPSLLRGFSAPIRLSVALSDDDLLFLLAHDRDSFNRWQAGQALASRLLIGASNAGGTYLDDAIEAYAAAMGRALADRALDGALLSQMLALPSESDIAREIGQNIDPDAIHQARRTLRYRLAHALEAKLLARYKAIVFDDPFRLDAEATADRALRTTLLDLLCTLEQPEILNLALAQVSTSLNMTECFGALTALAHHACLQREAALRSFYERHEGDALVIDKWFAIQATIGSGETVDRVRVLMAHEAFRLTNPNRVRALIASFAFSNPSVFNRADGAGYRFIADQVLMLDRFNPQIAARLLTAFRSWRMMEPGRRQAALKELQRIAAHPELSTDVEDIIRRTLEQAV